MSDERKQQNQQGGGGQQKHGHQQQQQQQKPGQAGKQQEQVDKKNREKASEVCFPAVALTKINARHSVGRQARPTEHGALWQFADDSLHLPLPTNRPAGARLGCR